jgi:hypothetical protein
LLLRERGTARNSWEIAQLNEMLTSMERAPYPFACTTNAPDILDPATMRRFLFKVPFLPMTAEQIAAATTIADLQLRFGLRTRARKAFSPAFNGSRMLAG